MTKDLKSKPRLQFNSFNDEWHREKLENVAEIARGKSKHRPRDASFLYGGPYPFVQTGDIKAAGLYLTDYTQTYSEEGLKQSRLWAENTLCITIAANIAETAILKIKACFPDSIIGLIPKENVAEVLFIKYLFDKFKSEIQNLSEGVAQDNLNLEKLSRLQFCFPTLAEQQKIASFLSSVDTKIQQLTKKKQLLEQYKKGVMQKIFKQEIRFKDENGKSFPKWEEKRLGDILTFKSTNSFSRSLLNYEKGNVYNIHYGDIHTKHRAMFDAGKSNLPFVNESTDLSKIDADAFCKVGDIIIADASEDYKDLGKAIEVIRLDNKKILAGLHTFLGRDEGDATVTGFKGYLMQTHQVRNQIMTMATGISVLGISKSNLSKVKFHLPSKAEQKKIVDFLMALDKNIQNLNQELELTKQFKKGLLQQMFV